MAFGASQIAPMIAWVVAGVVHEDGRRPEICRVTVIAIFRTLEVSRVHSSSLDPIVAGGAGSRDALVVKVCRCPCDRRMADIALCIGADVVHILTRGRTAIVAGGTGPRSHTCVIKHSRDPRIYRMTVIAGIDAGDVCRVFASGNDAVVTTGAGADDMGVIDL